MIVHILVLLNLSMVGTILSLGYHPAEGTFANEAKFTTYLNKLIKERGGFVHKISDYSPGQKPFDVIAALDGTVMAIELKYTKSKSFSPYRYLRGSSASNPGGQTVSLEKFYKNGGLSLVIVYSVALKGYIVFDYRQLDKDNSFIYKYTTNETPHTKLF